MQTQVIEHHFNGLRLQVKTELSYDEVLKRLRELTGTAPLAELNALANATLTKEQFEREVTDASQDCPD